MGWGLGTKQIFSRLRRLRERSRSKQVSSERIDQSDDKTNDEPLVKAYPP
jgi:hypothetical protein